MPAAGASPPAAHRDRVRPAPLTIPALQQWDPAHGVWRLGASVKIAVRRDQPTARRQAEVLAADLGHATHAAVRVAVGATPDQGDIVMRTVAANSRLGREGYRLRVGGALTIAAPTATGLFYGGRTLLELLHEGHTVPRGTAVDWPRYPQRGLMVDASRTTYSTRWVLREIRRLAALKLNVLHLHLTDDQRRAITSRAYPSIVAKHAFTRADIRRIVAGGQSGLDAMRAYPLDNETGPPVPFRVFNGRAASASGSLRSVSGARGAGPAAASGSSDQVSLPPGSKKP